MKVGKRKLDIVRGLLKLLSLLFLRVVLLKVSSSFGMQLCFQLPVSLMNFIVFDDSCF